MDTRQHLLRKTITGTASNDEKPENDWVCNIRNPATVIAAAKTFANNNINKDKMKSPSKSNYGLSREDESDSEENQDIDGLETIDENRPKFLNNKRLLITYKGHHDKPDLEEYFRSIAPNIKFFRAAHESSDKTDPYDHTHVLVEFFKPFQSNDCRVFDLIADDFAQEYENKYQYMSYEELGHDLLSKIYIHPHFKKIKTNKHWRNALYYIAKQDHENADLKFRSNIIHGVHNCNTLQEALAHYARGFGDVAGIIAAYSMKNHMDDMEDLSDHFRRWQIQLREIIDDPPSKGPIIPTEDVPEERWGVTPFVFPSLVSRKVIIVWDEAGQSGKTWFCKQMVISNPERYYMIQGCASTRDIASVIKSGFDSGWHGKVLLVNLTRSFADNKNIYDPLESIIDGCITVTKYAGKSMMWNPDYIVLFCNWMPNLKMMTLDRYVIFGIDNKFKTLFDLSIRQALEIYQEELGRAYSSEK